MTPLGWSSKMVDRTKTEPDLPHSETGNAVEGDRSDSRLGGPRVLLVLSQMRYVWHRTRWRHPEDQGPRPLHRDAPRLDPRAGCHHTVS